MEKEKNNWWLDNFSTTVGCEEAYERQGELTELYNELFAEDRRIKQKTYSAIYDSGRKKEREATVGERVEGNGTRSQRPNEIETGT